MLSTLRALCALCFFLSLVGCPDPSTDAKPRTPGPDTSSDAASGDASDAEGSDGGEPDVAVPNPDAEVPGPACVYPSDCPDGDCVDGLCRFAQPARCLDDAPCPDGETCGGFNWNGYCYRPCEATQTCPLRVRPCEANVGCPDGSSCHDGRCINSCETDEDCPADGYCYEGQCLVYPSDILDGDAPEPLAEAGLLAGASVVPLSYPMGVSAAGYGGRPGPRTPYSPALGGSDRMHEAMDVRVIALATPDDTLIVLRLPLSWSTDYILTLTSMKLQALTRDAAHPKGIDYSTKIVTGATHSHSQPGRYWNLIPSTGFGVFGYGLFSPSMVDRYTTSFAEGIKAALDDLKPARIGYTLRDEFDPQRQIHSDRRSESPEFLDDRLLVWKVEDLDGNPIAGLVNFAMHGTHMEETWLTGDAPGAVERILSDNMSARYDRPVPVMYINGNAGNVSPRGDDSVRPPWGKIQVVGKRVWPIFESAWDDAVMREAPRLEVLQRRIPISYDLMGYDASVPEFRARDLKPQRYGAFQCVQRSKELDEPPHMDGALGCIINLQAFVGAPVVQLQKTVLSTFRIDDLVIATLPGEATSELGVALSQAIEADAAAAGDPVRVMNFAYSMDHHLYLLLEDDWFRGGYEAAQGLWGWKLGRYLLNNSQALAAQLFTPEKEDNHTGIKPTWWPSLTPDKVDPTPTTGAGDVVTDLAPTARRGDLLDLEWTGGHPEVDQPLVVLEFDGGEGFAPAIRNGAVFDDGGFESLRIYRGDYAANHTWAARWELPFDLPEGRYRLVADGNAFDGADTNAYRVESAAFQVRPAVLVIREVTVVGDRIAAKVNYPSGPSNDDGESLFEALETRGHWLRLRGDRHFNEALKEFAFILGEALPPELPVTLRLSGAADVEVEVQPFEDAVSFDVVTARTDAGEATKRVEGWPATRVELTAPVPGEYDFEVSDVWGNAAAVRFTVE